MLKEPVYTPAKALEVLEQAMRAPQPAGQKLRALGVTVGERVTPKHSLMDRLGPTAHEYGFSARTGRYDPAERTTHVWVFNERD